MADSKKGNSSFGFFLLLVLLFVVADVVIVMTAPREAVLAGILEERQMYHDFMSEDALRWIEDHADGWYQSQVEDTGLRDAVYKFLIPSQEAKAKSFGLENMGSGLWPVLAGRLDNLFASLSQMYYRIAADVVWWPLLPLMLAPVLFDGVLAWKIRRFEFHYASPLRHRSGITMLTASIMMAPMAWIVPYAMPPWLFPPVLMPMVATGLYLFLSQTQMRW